MVRSLQLVVHLGAMMTPMPSNCIEFFKYLVPVVRYDFLNMQVVPDDSMVGDAVLKEDIVTNQFWKVNYFHISILRNTTTLRFHLALFLLKLLLYPIIVLF
jgi:hypothetical protein